ncbi:MAG: efflux RND transporter periplasmic adaptor subunit [Myxococcaceae bacterium]
MNKICLLLALALAACHEASPTTPPSPPEHRDDDEGHEPLPSTVKLSPEVAARAGIKTAAVRRIVLGATLTLTGEVVAPPDRTAKVSSATPGRLERVTFNEGAVVTRGEVLATVRVPDLGRLRGAFTSASTRAKAARANATRLAQLKASGLGAEQAVIDAEADARALESEASALGEQLDALGAGADASGFQLALRAPLSGTVVSRAAVVGQPVATDDVLGTIVDLSEVWFLARVFEKDLARLTVGRPAEVEVNAFPGEHFHGTVEYVSQQIDPLARTLTARVRLPNADGRLRLGLFGRAIVEVGALGANATPTPVVPRDALVDLGGRLVVFVKAADGDFVVHEVTRGDTALDDVQVLAGVKEGEEVVVQGAFTLKSLLLKSTLAEED